MTWHLKDRELEKNIIAIDPDFSKKLSRTCEKLDTNKDGDFLQSRYFTLTLVYDSKVIGDVLFSGKDVEKTSDYDPHNWNNFPEVTPPEGVYMRVEFEDKSGGKAVFYKNEWLDTDCTLFSFSPVKFRPWED